MGPGAGESRMTVNFEPGKVYYFRAKLYADRFHDALELTQIPVARALWLLPTLQGPLN